MGFLVFHVFQASKHEGFLEHIVFRMCWRKQNERVGYRKIHYEVPQNRAGVLLLEGTWRNVRHGRNT